MGADQESRWLRQTKRGGGNVPLEERGDCVPACIASILGLGRVDAIGNTHGEGWWPRLQQECARHGYCLAPLNVELAPPPTYWIASLPSLSLPAEPDGKQPWHSVVAHGYNLIHDPSLGERYDDALWTEAWNEGQLADGWVLVPLDPVQLIERPGPPLRPESDARADQGQPAAPASEGSGS